LKDLGLDRKIVLSWIYREWDVGIWTGSRWFRIRTGAGNL